MYVARCATAMICIRMSADINSCSSWLPHSVNHAAQVAWALQECGLRLQDFQSILEALDLCLAACLTLLVRLRLFHALRIELGTVLEHGIQLRLLFPKV